jgi:uncharacterized protein (TIGR00661 family)
MRILYGVVGEGMGHATRSRVVIDHLLTLGHRVGVVASDRGFPFLRDTFAGREGFSIQEIHGLHLDYEDNVLSVGRSLVSNLGEAPQGIVRNIATWLDTVLGSLDPDVVISDFESWAWFYGLNQRLPVISIDNMQIINRCSHPKEITRDPSFQVAKAAVKVKLPMAWHYVVTTFFYPEVRKERTTLVPPLLRPPILAASREPGEHVLVYQTGTNNPGLVPFLQRLPGTFRVYGLGLEGERGNVSLRPFSEQGFVDDLRTARAAVAGGGFSLMSECVHLGVPLFSVPIDGQYEQELNARYLAQLGYGDWAPRFEEERVAAFLASPPRQTAYVPQDNQRTFEAVDGLLASL